MSTKSLLLIGLFSQWFWLWTKEEMKIIVSYIYLGQKRQIYSLGGVPSNLRLMADRAKWSQPSFWLRLASASESFSVQFLGRSVLSEELAHSQGRCNYLCCTDEDTEAQSSFFCGTRQLHNGAKDEN